jgi:hypothetical protein
MTEMLKTPVYMTERQPCLRGRYSVKVEDPKTWPVAASDVVFIWEAIDLAGKATFGDRWTGRELQAQYWPVSPAKALHRQRGEVLVDQLLAAAIPRLRKPAPNFQRLSTAISNQQPKFSEHVLLWRAVRAYNHETAAAAEEDTHWEDNRLSLDRLSAVVEWFGRKCRDQQIRCFTRITEGGALRVMPANDWNAEPTLSARISLGGWSRPRIIDPKDYAGRLVAIHDEPKPELLYIFVDRESLSQAVSSLKHAPMVVTERDLAALPEPLKIAIAIAISQPDVATAGEKTRKAKAREEWNRRYPSAESEKYIEAIGTVLGIPDLDKIVKQKSLRKTAPPTK